MLDGSNNIFNKKFTIAKSLLISYYLLIKVLRYRVRFLELKNTKPLIYYYLHKINISRFEIIAAEFPIFSKK